MSKTRAELIIEKLEREKLAIEKSDRETELSRLNNLTTEEIERENALLLNKFLQEQKQNGNKTDDKKIKELMSKLTFKLFLMLFIWGPMCAFVIWFVIGVVLTSLGLNVISMFNRY